MYILECVCLLVPLELTCIAKMLLGRTSLCCLILKCHVLILIMSSNMNSRYKRPSTQTLSTGESGNWMLEHQQQQSGLQKCIFLKYLGEHRFSILGHHSALVTVERHKVTVKGLFRML